MEVASVRETANFTNNTNAVTPYSLGQVLDSYATESYVTDAIAHAQLDPAHVDLSEYAKKTDLPSKLSQLTNDANYVQTVSGVIPSSLLPSYVNDVLEYISVSAFPNPGESNKIYIAMDTNLVYRWTGSQYVEISKSLALGTTSTTAFRGDYGNTAYQHSQATGNPHNLQLSDLGITVSSTEINYLYGLTDTVENLLAQKLNLSGGIMTGYLTLNHNPTQRMHAATKDYVDAEIAGVSVSVTQNITAIRELNQSVNGLSSTVAVQGNTITNVINDVGGLNQTTEAHTQAITDINQTVDGLSTTVSETTTMVTNLEASINQLSAEFDTQGLFVLVDSDGYPFSDVTYTMNYQCYFRGEEITPTSATLSGSNTGITTSQETNKVKFTVDDNTAIPNEVNMYSIEFIYIIGGFPYTLVKDLRIITVPEGKPGEPGQSGKAVESMQELYYKSTSPSQLVGGSWVTSYPGWSTGYYIWTKTRTTYTDTTYIDTEPIMVTDTTTGWTTIEGVGITDVDVWYYLSTSNTTLSGGSWQTTVPTYDASKYLWTKTRTTYSNDFSDESAPMCVSGTSGQDGKAVDSVTLYFKVVDEGDPAPAKPTTDIPTGWSISEPAVDMAKNLYSTMKTTYSDSTFEYSDPQMYSSYEAAKTAYNTATNADANASLALAGSVIKSASEPTDTTRIWLDLTTGMMKQYIPDGQGGGEWTIINDFTDEISDIENTLANVVTISTVNELIESAKEGVTNTFKTSGGYNLFRNTGLWFETGNNSNPYEFWVGNVGRISEDKAVNRNALLLKNNTLYQEQNVPNGNYNVSFKYKKLLPLSTISVKINDKTYSLDQTTDTEFITGQDNIDELLVTSQTIKVQFISDMDDACEVYDLMVNSGNVQLAYSQNQNETTTDTVNISEGITITSSNNENIVFKANYDGVRIYDKTNMATPITKFTDKGTETKELIVTGKSEISGLLIQDMGDQTWITKI